jgi:hypothetical protein
VAFGIVIVFEGVTEQDYWAVNDKLGIARDDWSEGWPDGAISHTAGPTATGWVVTEVWQSKAAQERFMAERLGPALHGAGLPAPSQVIESELINYKTESKKK